MVFLLKYCTYCQLYTLKDVCPRCKKKTKTPHPPKFSLIKEERYSHYRRRLLEEKKQ